MARPAIYEPAITQFVVDGREAVQALNEANENVDKHERQLTTSREDAQKRRIELGRVLIKVRDSLPKRGDKEGGWRLYLEAIELGPTSAWRYMKEAGAVFQLGEVERMGAQPSETTTPPQDDIPPPNDDDAPVDVDVSDLGADEPEVEIDRDTWCTPREFTEALGQVDLDPCANDRSHVQATTTFNLENFGQDGLELAATVTPETLTFINPPYSSVMPWIIAYAHVRFCFLLKFDPSTKWFAELMKHTGLVLIPKGTRIQFEAPPGVPKNKSEANQFPHAFFFARAEDAPQALLDRCYVWRVELAA